MICGMYSSWFGSILCCFSYEEHLADLRPDLPVANSRSCSDPTALPGKGAEGVF